MGGSRPWTLGRGLSLAALVAVTLGIMTGLSHVGHSTIDPCNGSWEVVLGRAIDGVNASTITNRAAKIAPTPCLGYDRNANGTYFAVATLPSEMAGTVYVNTLLRGHYAEIYGITPYVRPKPASAATPTQ